MSLEDFIQDDRSDLARQINESVQVLNEKAGGFHFNALPKLHQVLINSGFKPRLPSGKILTGRHHKHLQAQLAKYSQSDGTSER
jgi:hypothetical protein